MMNVKTLSFCFASAAIAALTLPASAQVELRIGTVKTYREHQDSVRFRGGSYTIAARDGDGVYRSGCVRRAYWAPNLPLDPCPGGSTAYLQYGNINSVPDARGNYYWVESVIPAIVIEPRRPELVRLTSAPASTLPRPSAGFIDGSFSLYYNLHTTSIREYVVSRYGTGRFYTADQRTAFEKEIVPGVYYYAFPRLRNPTLVQSISAVIYPMVEGLQRINNQRVGVEFTSDNGGTWDRSGFLQLSVSRPNVIRWKGFSPTTVFAATDKLYFTIRGIADETNPESDTNDSVIFPGFSGAADARVLLGSPYETSFTLPPIFPAGTTGVIELELDRGFQTSAVTYDNSRRRFQLPVTFTD